MPCQKLHPYINNRHIKQSIFYFFNLINYSYFNFNINKYFDHTGVAVASSVFTITAMSVDRYLAITQSLRQPWIPSRRGACGLLVGLWLVAFAIFAPLLVVATVEREQVPSLFKTKNESVRVGDRFIFFILRGLALEMCPGYFTNIKKRHRENTKSQNEIIIIKYEL